MNADACNKLTTGHECDAIVTVTCSVSCNFFLRIVLRCDKISFGETECKYCRKVNFIFILKFLENPFNIILCANVPFFFFFHLSR